jgi:hypothetical protein
MLLTRSGFAANGPVDACIAMYERYENRLAAGDLLAARKSLTECGASSCPDALQRECVTVAAALAPRIPTVVLVAHDAARRDLSEVRVSLDGAPLRARLDGREIEVNPGPHRFRFEIAGADPIEQSVVIREREKGRVIAADFPPSALSVDAPSGERASSSARERDALATRRAVPASSWILGGVGLAALATSGAFGALGLAARADADQCKPDCTPRQVDAVNQRFLFSDVALGVSVVSFAAAVIVYLVQPSEARAVESRR